MRPRRVLVGERAWWMISAAAIAFSVVAAWRRRWWCDDAFISFRYAHNLNAGLGLVYNAGERVEGFSNFLWTLWTALGMRLGVRPETWSAAWGIVFYAATVALLCQLQRRDARERQAVWIGLPVAALLAVAHRDLSVFATSGLETGLVTFLSVSAYALVIQPALGERGAALSGVVTALAALTRPEAFLLAPVIGAWMVWALRPRARMLAAYAAGFLVLWGPFLAWRLAYYGDWLPNTFYAKSAWLPWYRQGWIYFGLYARQYGVVLAGLPLVLVAALLRRHDTKPWRARVVLAAAIALVYTAYVVRVGGDFMYARLLLPPTAFYLILVERGLSLVLRDRPLPLATAAAALFAILLFAPYPFSGKDGPSGIANEPLFYPPGDLETQQHEGAVLHRYFAGTSASVAYCGAQARLVYYADPAVAIESATGLTDRWIAHQPLAHRGRIGHEKPPPVSYLLRRGVDFTVGYASADVLHLGDWVPWTRIWFDDVPGNIVHWDSGLLAEMARRGARFPDVPRYLEGYGAAIDSIPLERVRADFERFRRFYFDYAEDSLREAPFAARLEAR